VAVRRLLDRQVDDWNRKDLDGFLTGYWNAPGVVFQSGGDRLDGFEAMRARYRDKYQAKGREMGTLAFNNVDVIVLAPDAALVRGRWQLTLSDGKRPGGLYTLLVRRLPEGWRIVHDHTSAAP
jgi:beta-aspartyl-peptidase (threonine type)